MTPAVQIEQSLEMQVLQQVGEVRSMVRELTIKLFGDVAIESQEGRLPALQATVRSLERRVEKLERLVWLVTGAGIVIGFLLKVLVK